MSDLNDPLVSIVLPNRNHAEFLPESLGALAQQTWENLEVLIVDDASTDNSCAAIEDWSRQDSRFKLIQLKHHVGINKAVEQGLRQAKGAYLIFAAADDFTSPDFIEKSLSMLRNNPDAAFCFSDPSEFHSNNEINKFPLYLSTEPRFYTNEQFANLLRRNFFNVSANTVLYRRSSFEDVGGYLDDLDWMSDWFASTITSLRFGVCYIPECLTRLRVREDSYSAVNLQRSAEHRKLITRVFEYLNSNEYEDVRCLFRFSALMPEYRLRTLWWLLFIEDGRYFVTSRLLTRVLWRGIWHYLRNYMPSSQRRTLRQISSARAKQKVLMAPD